MFVLFNRLLIYPHLTWVEGVKHNSRRAEAPPYSEVYLNSTLSGRRDDIVGTAVFAVRLFGPCDPITGVPGTMINNYPRGYASPERRSRKTTAITSCARRVSAGGAAAKTSRL